MNGCTAVLDLGYTDDIGQPVVARCEHPAGHHGPHYTEVWDPDGTAWYGPLGRVA